MSGVARSIRVKINLNLNNPLKKGTKIKIGSTNPMWIPVTYERLPSFCYWCGIIGHNYRECETWQEEEERYKEVQESKIPFGEWLRSSPMKKAYVFQIHDEGYGRSSRKELFTQPEIICQKEREDQRKEDKTRIKTNEQQIKDLSTNMEKINVSSKEEDRMAKKSSETMRRRLKISDEQRTVEINKEITEKQRKRKPK